MKRTLTSIAIVIFCLASTFAQSRHTKRPDLNRTPPGHYFTISVCHACAYFGWHEDTIKGFRAKSIRAAVGGGYVAYANRTSNERFAPVRAFKWERSEEFWPIELLVGPFSSAETASRALDDFPAVLLLVQRKRNRMEGSNGGWPISQNERVSHVSGNNYSYGFFDITGYRLLH